MTLFDVPAAGSGGGVASGSGGDADGVDRAGDAGGVDPAGGTDAAPHDPGPPPIRMTVAYDGTDFRGFARQKDVRTVAGVIEGALAKVLRTEVDLACAGRTDAGVHAWGQVISFEAPPGADPDSLRDRLNRMLGPEVVVRDARFAEPGFDARHSARARTYRYTVVNRREPDPFLARTAWWVPEPIDLHALQLAADPFIGEHDFAAFCRKGPAGSTTMRRILGSEWVDLGDGVLRYEVRATAFCWQMVRALVGTQVEAGLGKRRPGAMLSILRSGDRSAAGALAPPHGLCLWHVAYDAEEHHR